jgi:hypothetical protein
VKRQRGDTRRRDTRKTGGKRQKRTDRGRDRGEMEGKRQRGDT